MTKKNKKDGFMIQAAILAAAGFLSRIIGLLYAVPLYQIIGEEGNGYYATAYDIYFMILLISTYSIPTAVSKVISQRLAVEEYKNANKLFKCSLIYVLIVGSFTAAITFIFAPSLVVDQSVLCLRIMAPTIFFSGLLSVFRGYMQAHNTMVPTAVSQIIEQIMNAVVSVAAAYMFTMPFRGGVDESKIAVHGAAGSALGTFAGVMAGLVFILIIYLRKRSDILEKVSLDKNTHEETYRDLFKVIFLMVTPVILSTFIYNVSTTFDMKIYWSAITHKSISTKDAARTYGIYSRQFLVLINLPIAIASAVSSALIPGISGAYSKGDIEDVNTKLNKAVRTTMLIMIPSAIGMAVLANPIMQLLFSGTDERAGYALAGGCISIVCYALSTVTNGVLQAIGKVSDPVKNAAITLIIHLAFVIIGLNVLSAPYSLAILVGGSIVYSFFMVIFNAHSIKKHLGYKMDMDLVFLRPAVSAAVMGAFAVFIYKTIYHICINVLPGRTAVANALSLLISILIAIIIYAFMILRIGGYTEEEILDMPKGKLIVKLAKKLKLMK
ncbi:MAG: polysaccharide biosynthesis protein [Lachnospiraceae bacterium]|nr:polysaccharide biosynthesis protein [Lachnospiraceae bacterium]